MPVPLSTRHVDANEVVSAIIRGDLDLYLDTIAERLANRRDLLARRVAARIDVGDTIRFTDKARPTYLYGLTAVVTKINGKSVTVTCPSSLAYRRYSGVVDLRCPITIVEPLDA